MRLRLAIIALMLGGFLLTELPTQPPTAEAAQSTVKKKKKKVQQKKSQHRQGKKKYPWGEPNAGWDDRCIFYFDTYDGWIPPICRPYGRMY
jgi:hypothetical protein